MQPVWIYIHIVAIFVQYFTNNSVSAGEPVHAKVLFCHDGDTCRVQFGDNVSFNIRLAGIDAPEVKSRKMTSSQPHGEAARDFLNKSLQNQTVRITQLDLDQYNRPIVEIYKQATLMNLEMISQGHAEVFRGKRTDPRYRHYVAAELKAKVAKLGIWQLPGYESPAIYRKKLTFRSRR